MVNFGGPASGNVSQYCPLVGSYDGPVCSLLNWKGGHFLWAETLASGKLSVSLKVGGLASFLEILSACECEVGVTLGFS